MNIRNVIKRIGLVFIIVPIWVICILLNIIFCVLLIFWGPIYYIIIGKDPFRENILGMFLEIGFSIADWYIRVTNLELE